MIFLLKNAQRSGRSVLVDENHIKAITASDPHSTSEIEEKLLALEKQN